MVRPLLILSARHRPLEIAVLLASLLTGVFGLFSSTSGQTINSVDRILPGYGWVWYVGITLGALTALVSIFMSIPSSLLWERIGLSILATFFIGFSFASVTFAGAAGLRGSLFLLAFGLGAVFRARQITQDLRMLENAVKEKR